MKRKEAQRIARQRIERLFELARQVSEKKPELARRYVGLARRIGMRHNVRLPARLKRTFCKACNSLLIPSKTVRIRAKKRVVVVTCLVCGAAKRYPYRKEKY